LSFPHGWFSQKIQEYEVGNILYYLNSEESLPIIFVGDFNATQGSVTYDSVTRAGYESGHYVIHKREPIVSHLNHQKQAVCTDYIFSKLPEESNLRLNVLNAELLPSGISDNVWPESFTISDHRPLLVDFVFQIKPQNP
jgi:endonuclease/exonuclease/phosphatase (EEP) superfamily protein YafD